MAKTKPQSLSGCSKRKKRAKRLACNKRLSVAMNQFVLKTEDNRGDSENLPGAKISTPAKEEEIEVESTSETEKKISSFPVPEVEIQDSDFDANFQIVASVPDEEIPNNLDSNFEVLTSVPQKCELKKQNKSQCENQPTFTENIFTNLECRPFVSKEETKEKELECIGKNSTLKQNACDSNSNDFLSVPPEKESNTEVETTLETNLVQNFINYSDPALWPPITDSIREYFTNIKLEQNISYLSNSKKVIGGIERTCSKNNFFRYKKNGELVSREWLVYSPSVKAVFCYVCKLYGGSNDQALCKDGFSDWRNIVKRLQSHENSEFHRRCMFSFSSRSKSSNRIDNNLVEQFENECEYWRKILFRVVAVIKYISLRGLSCFGDDETFGSVHNGNFLGILELLASFDSFLADHIYYYGNKGKGNVNYLSSTIVTEFIEIMSDRVLKEIVKQIQQAKYFGLIVDSTPDISHIDQLAIVLRYVNQDEPVERFLKFIPIHSHSSEHLHEVVINFLQSLNIELKYCRGQSFDNASNMSGKYSGLQARLKKDFPLIHYVPCAAHSLNLIGTSAAECCHSAVSFFGVVQSLYNFFSASTHRWELMNEESLFDASNLTLKSLSGTRWSANADAVKVLKKKYMIIFKVLDAISSNENETATTRHDAKRLHSKMSKFEFALMTVIWDSILQRMNNASKTIQSENCKMSTIVPLYNSLIKFVQHVRNHFDDWENQAETLIGNRSYTESRPKKVTKSRMLDETSSKNVELSCREKFLFQTHYVICDSLISALEKRKCAYVSLESIFGFMCNENLSELNIKESAKKFHDIYSEDIEEEFPDEFLQFNEFVTKDLQPIQKLKLIKSLNIEQTFPNVEVALRIMLSIPISNCSSERSFSVLKRIKNRMRSSLSQNKVSGLSLLAIESDITTKLDFNDIIDEFARRKSRKKAI